MAIPWVTEVSQITRGVPRTSRIPTGGWRSYGAVPSHSYPAESTIPGYWQGIGYVASPVSQAAQSAKTTFGGFGQEEPKPKTATQSGTAGWLDGLKAIAGAATGAYQANLNYMIQRQQIAAGQPPVGLLTVTPGPGAVAAGTVPAPAMMVAPKTSPMVWVGLAAAGGALLYVMTRKRG